MSTARGYVVNYSDGKYLETSNHKQGRKEVEHDTPSRPEHAYQATEQPEPKIANVRPNKTNAGFPPFFPAAFCQL